MVIIIMGVSGAGKTTIGKMLAERLGWLFVEGDSFHPPENIEKMNRGVLLSDMDRHPWLVALGTRIRELADSGTPAIVTCAALRAHYRKYLCADNHPDVRIVYLQGDEPLIRPKYKTGARGLVGSQFEIADESDAAFTVSAQLSPREIIDRICRQFAL